MIIQTAPAGRPRLAIMMYEHTALAHQLARSFGNDRFEAPEPNDLMFHVVLHHDAGWAAFDRDPVTDPSTGLPYNLVERAGTTFEHVPLNAREDATITVRPRGSGVYELAPCPFAAESAELAFGGRHIAAGQHEKHGGWPNVLAKAPTEWERFRLVAG